VCLVAFCILQSTVILEEFNIAKVRLASLNQAHYAQC